MKYPSNHLTPLLFAFPRKIVSKKIEAREISQEHPSPAIPFAMNTYRKNGR